MSSKTQRPPTAMHSTGRGWRRLTATVTTTAIAAAAVGAVAVAAPATAAPDADATLVVSADEPFREVTHVATGSLYGIADEGLPSQDLIDAIKPNTFLQMPPDGNQQYYGDVLNVWQSAEDAGAGVVVRLSDYYAGWPYQFSWENTDDRKAWEDVVRDVVAQIQEAGVTNVVAWAPWNESDNTWLEEENGSFNDFWVFTYDLLRELLGDDAVIQGPSFSDNITDMEDFLTNAVATDTVPDVLEWHELIHDDKIQGDIEQVRAIEAELGIGDLPIDIGEYASPSEVGLPGSLVGYIAKFERYGVTRAELAFWNGAGTLGDLLTGTGGVPNGAYWLYTWYADMSGQMVTTTPPSNESDLDGAASVNDAKDQIDVITGGASGTTSIQIDGLDELNLGDEVNVTLEMTPSYGRTTATEGPITISSTNYEVGEDGSITVPIVMNPAYGYHVVVTAASEETASLAGTYTLQNINSGLVLDTADGSTENGAYVVQSEATGGETQTWDVVEAGSGLYKIVNAATGLVLGVQDASTENGAPALTWYDSGTDDHLWQLVPDGDGNVRLTNYGTGLVLGVEGMSTEAGASVIQWTDGAPTSNCSADGERQAGKIGTALDFCSSVSYVTAPEGVVSDLTGDWSISTWVKPSSLDSWARVFDFGTGTNVNMFLTLNNGSGPQFAITTSGSGGEQKITYNGQNLALDEWSLVTVTVSGTTGTLYIDGEAVASNTDMTIHPSDLGATTNNWLGKSQYGSDAAYDGALDDFAIYDRALSADEIAELASGQPADDADVLHYAFDEESGATAIDSSGRGQDGTITAGAGQASTTTASDEDTADRFWTLVPADDTEPTPTPTPSDSDTAAVVSLTGSGELTVGASYTLTATLSPEPGSGTVSFFDGDARLADVDVESGTEAPLALVRAAVDTGVSYTVASLTAGTHAYSACYTAAGAAACTPTTTLLTVTVPADGTAGTQTSEVSGALATTGGALPWVAGVTALLLVLVGGGMLLRARARRV